jgi:hypothetical protein
LGRMRGTRAGSRTRESQIAREEPVNSVAWSAGGGV